MTDEELTTFVNDLRDYLVETALESAKKVLGFNQKFLNGLISAKKGNVPNDIKRLEDLTKETIKLCDDTIHNFLNPEITQKDIDEWKPDVDKWKANKKKGGKDKKK